MKIIEKKKSNSGSQNNDLIPPKKWIWCLFLNGFKRLVHAGENIPKYLLNSEIILNSDFWSEMTGKQSLPVSSRDATKKY